ncbi:MAG: hypothetical protein FD149_27 [Rhodospirillaceae bacterium]|nr:MAG: hypothetical protein FD149_27 [Rhodospirillaceae bacterium]
MSGQGITTLDAVVALVVLLSGLIGFIRGFVHEVLGIAAWVGAGFVALYGFVWVRPLARNIIPVPWAADAAAVVVLFLAALLVLSMLSHAVAGAIRMTLFGSFDRALGFLFGLARGALVVSLAYLLIEALVRPDDRPAWLQNARSLVLMQRGSALIRQLAPDELVGKAKNATDAATERVRQIRETEEAYKRLANPVPRAQGAQGAQSPREAQNTSRSP